MHSPVLVYILAIPLGMLLSGACTWLELRPWRKSIEAHWTERARALYPARVAAGMNVIYIPAAVALFTYNYDRQLSWAATGLLCYLGALLGVFPMERSLYPELNLKRCLHLAAATVVLRSLNWLTLMVAAALMPVEWGGRSVALFLAYAGCLTFLQWGGGVALLRWLGVARAPSARVSAVVDRAGERVGVRPRGVWELDNPAAGAFAIVTRGVLLFTTKLVDVAPDEELEAVCAHELGHLSESRWVIAARVISGWTFMPLIFARPIAHHYSSGGIAMLGLIIVLAWLGASRMSRAMEKRADKIARHTASEGPVFARALERIYRTNHLPAVTKSRTLATHPDLYDRMLAADLVPEYPRPKPPTAFPLTPIVFLVAGMIAFATHL